MPIPYLQKLSKDMHLPISTLERYWKEATEQVARQLGKPPASFDAPDYANVVGIIKKRVANKKSQS